jgi:hypothetical protein
MGVEIKSDTYNSAQIYTQNPYLDLLPGCPSKTYCCVAHPKPMPVPIEIPKTRGACTRTGASTCERRPDTAVQAALEQQYRDTVLESEFPSSVFFSTQLVSDVKDIQFGWHDSLAYASCHRGISPFGLPHTSIESHQALAHWKRRQPKQQVLRSPMSGPLARDHPHARRTTTASCK